VKKSINVVILPKLWHITAGLLFHLSLKTSGKSKHSNFWRPKHFANCKRKCFLTRIPCRCKAFPVGGCWRCVSCHQQRHGIGVSDVVGRPVAAVRGHLGTLPPQKLLFSTFLATNAQQELVRCVVELYAPLATASSSHGAIFSVSSQRHLHCVSLPRSCVQKRIQLFS